jgi:T5SS/PEP-CTERM-associated repeat protein
MIRSADWSARFFTTRGLAMRSIALLATTSLAFLAGENVAVAQAGEQLVILCFRNRTIQVPFYLVNRYTASGATIGPCPSPTTSWIFDGAGDWFVSANWSAGAPGAATNAQINNGGTAQIVGTSAAARNVSLGNLFEGSGTLEVQGSAAAFNDMDVGLVGSGALLIGNGGQVSVATSGIIGDGPESSGTATVNGTSSRWNNVGSLDVGNYGRGTLSIQNSGAVANTNGYIGHLSDSIGTATVDGVGSTWTNSGDLYVGHTGSGTLSVSNGGKVSNFNANIGAVSGSDSTARVDGPGSVWTNNSVLAVGSSGAGALSITGGGVVSSTIGRIARASGSSGTVVIDGANSRWSASNVFTMGLFDTGTATLNVQNGGVLSATGGMTIGPLGTVRGDGTLVADVFNAGTVAPGTSPGTLRVNGNFQQSVGGRLQIELASASFDKLDVSGEITLDNTLFGPPLGGTLEVSLTGGYVPLGTKSFDILDWAGSFSGEFSAIALPTLGGTLVWDTSQLYINGTLSVTGPASLAGDYNADGNVDAADYVVWRNGLGTTYTQNDYDAWRANFGQSAGSGAALPSAETLSAAVPEPCSWVLFCLGIIAFTGPDRTIGLRRRCNHPSLAGASRTLSSTWNRVFGGFGCGIARLFFEISGESCPFGPSKCN